MQSCIKSMYKLVVYTNLLLAIGASALVYGTTVIMNKECPTSLLLVAFLITYFVYTFNRYTDIKEDIINYPERSQFVIRWKKFLLPSSLLSLIFGIILVAQRSIMGAAIILSVVLISILYNVSMTPFTRLKERFLVKNIVVAAAWALGVIVLPLVYLNVKILQASVVYLIIYMFIMCFVNTVMFDMRDIKGDRKSGVQTIPVKFGFKNTKIILEVMLVLLLFSTLVSYKYLFGIRSLPLIITNFYLLISLIVATPSNIRAVADILADGFPIIYGVSALVIAWL